MINATDNRDVFLVLAEATASGIVTSSVPSANIVSYYCNNFKIRSAVGFVVALAPHVWKQPQPRVRGHRKC